MATQTDKLQGGVFVPARRIPAPPTISPYAQAVLANPPEFSGPQQPDDPHDKAAWRAYVDGFAQLLTAQIGANAQIYPSEVITHQLAQVPLYEVVPKSLTPNSPDGILFHVHGGGYVHGAGVAGAYTSMPLASTAQMRTFSVDYRMPPDHPFPTGLEDAVEAYRWVLKRYKPENIVVCGESAGAGLAASVVLKVRDLGLPMPRACVLATPEADLTESGDTFETNDTVDTVARHRLTKTIAVYANGHDLRDPYLSPLFGDFSKGFPPTILTTGTRDLFLSNTVLMHRALLRAGIEAQLHVWEAMPHGGFFGAPEDQELLAQQASFIRQQLCKT